METTASFGYWIRRQRKALDLTQQVLAERVGCSLAAIKKIESDERRPSRQIAERLADILGVPASQRKIFLECARGLRPVDQLSLAREPVGRTPTPPETPESFHHNLPVQLTSFIGRERELEEAKQLLSSTRLLTLTGPGGTGKTRLALEIAQDVLPSFRNGVWLVELAPLTDPSLIPQTIASVFELREAPKMPLIEVLTNYLRAKQLLLILDNCEHLIAACAKLSADLLHVCPQLKIIASSREALGISGETVYRVPSLSLPDPAQVTREALMESEAVQLFVERAMAVQSHFALQDSNASAVIQICHRLDGIPLALELATARIAVFSPEEIACRLDDRFKLLTGGSRTALERHQTLRALIDWSYDLLSDEERILFRQLSVFAGGWTFEAAEAVCSGLDVLNLLTQLVNKSLVLVGEQGKGTRYRLPETVRQYASDKLLESDKVESVRDRHLDYFLRLAERAEPHLRRAEQIEWLNQLDAEHDNLRTALVWAMDKPSVEPALRLVGALGTFWGIRAYWLEGGKWIDRALDKGWDENRRPEKAARAKALYRRADLAEALDEVSLMKTCAESALALCKEVNDNWGIAYARAMLAYHLIKIADYEASKALFEQSLNEFQRLGDAWGESVVLSRLSIAEANLGEIEKYSEDLQNALARVRVSGDRDRTARSLLNIANNLLFRSEWDRAEKILQEADQLFAEIGSSNGINQIKFYHARVFLARGKLEEAKAELKLFTDWCLLVGERDTQAQSLLLLGLIAEIENKIEGAKEYLQHGLSLARETGLSKSSVRFLVLLGRLEYQQGNRENAIQYMREGLELVKSGQVGGQETLFVYCQVSGMLVERKPQIAVQLLGSTEAFWQAAHFPRNPTFDKPYFERFLSAARAKLSEAEFNAAWEAGLKLSEEQAFALATKIDGEDSDRVPSSKKY